MNDILECDGIYLEFGLSKVLTSIYIKCETGQITGLLGRNGSGKSCLLKIIFGALECPSKSIRINSQAILKYPSKKTIGYLPQQNFIPGFLTIKQALKIYGIPEYNLTEAFPELAELLRYKPHQFSGGMLRIIEVLLVLNLPAPFILLDEPFSGVMPVHVETLKVYMKEKKKEKGIIITDHLYRHITSIADNLYVLARGKSFLVSHLEQLSVLGYTKS